MFDQSDEKKNEKERETERKEQTTNDHAYFAFDNTGIK